MTVTRVPGLSQFDNTLYGHYRGSRWLILLRELWFLPWSLVALWRLRKRPYDLIHANEITLLPLAIIAKTLMRVPLVVHVRSVQSPPRNTLRSRWVNGLLARHADAVVAIDNTVARTLDKGLAVSIVHNSISVPADAGSNSEMPRSGPLRLGIFGVLIPAKGVRELVEAVQIVREQGVDVECWIAGENARVVSGLKAWLLNLFGFARDVRAELGVVVERHGLQQQVKFLGLVKDIRSLYRQIDVLCFPSHLNAAGRPVFEAALFGVPSIVAIRDPLPDAILHEETGLAISEPRPELIAEAIRRLAKDQPFRARLGRQARIWATGIFSLEQSANALRAVYANVLATRRKRT
jgi:glycosyltransferase involved in cell wall biosynthesis